LLCEYCGNITIQVHSLKGIENEQHLADLFPFLSIVVTVIAVTIQPTG